MKQGVARRSVSCPALTSPDCQTRKAKCRLNGNELIVATHPQVPFKVIHLDFAELKVKGKKAIQAFLVAIDVCTMFVAAKTCEEDANFIISLLERDLFKNTKVDLAN